MKRFLIAGLVGLASTLACAQEPAAAGAAKTAEQLSATCVSCHGPGGSKPIAPDYPIIAGQYRSYLSKALNEYKDGKRKNPTMGAMAKPLSAQDIEALAAYFEAQPSPLYTPTEQGATQ